MNNELHIFKGMQRDTHPSKQDKGFLWDAHNIRITAREGDTLFSVTNEKGTEELISFGNKIYIGHTVCGKFLVLFVKGDTDYIYRVDLDNLKKEVLYKGDLSLDVKSPIQAIPSYESELVQKVYWTDAKNGPRIINITKPELLGESYNEDDGYTSVYTDAPFDFVQNLELKEFVSVKRTESSNGLFAPGVIQYAFTYYHKYGQESNIFYTSEPLYIAYNDRGGAADQTISTAFEIYLDNLQVTFDYVRIYSIVRTTIDTVPTVKRVADVRIPEKGIATYIDNNTTGDNVDPTQLLYIGGKDLVASCIHAKDNVLFLGNISYNRREVRTIKCNDTSVEDCLKNLELVSSSRAVELDSFSDSSEKDYSETLTSFYSNSNQLFTNTSTFKCGDTYRLGLQFQYKNGEWSEPLHIGDFKSTSKPSLTVDDTEESEGLYKHAKNLHLPTFKVSDADSSFGNIIKNIENEGYVKIRPLIVPPSVTDRSVIAQGILCPTVYNKKAHREDSPYAQSSWLLRPYITGDFDNTLYAYLGSSVEYRHDKPLISGYSRGSEIQNMALAKDNFVWDDKRVESSTDADYDGGYYVNKDILTFHSPDIEFDDSLSLLFDGSNNFKMRVVGYVIFDSNYGDIDIQTSSSRINGDAMGYVHNSIAGYGSRSLVSGLFFNDSAVKDNKEGTDFSKTDYPYSWLVYMWHRSGSLNNDISRGSLGTRTAELRKKIISNIKYASFNNYINNEEVPVYDIQPFNSNEISLLRIKMSDGESKSYYGNVDSINPNSNGSVFVVSDKTGYEIDTSEDLSDYLLTITWRTFIQGDPIITQHYKITNVELRDSKVYIRLRDRTYNSSSDRINWNLSYMTIQGTISKTSKEETSIKHIKILDDEGKEVKLEHANSVSSCSATVKPGISSSSSAPSSVFNPVFSFDSNLTILTNEGISQNHTSLITHKDPVRIKYKSTPHLVVSVDQKEFGKIEKGISDASGLDPIKYAFLPLAEIYRDTVNNRYGTDIKENLWIVAGPAVRIDDIISKSKFVEWQWGDTWYQRYDCLKTYPFTNEDENQVIEIGSFMCETRVNIDGRTDRNRGLKSNLDVSPTNFNLLNTVYSQKNSFFNYRILDEDYYKVNSYPNQLLWTLVKSPASDVDLWTNLYGANSLDLDGSHGAITAIDSLNEILVAFQNTAVNKISFNERVQIEASDGVPIEIANSGRVEGSIKLSSTIGCQDKFAVVSTPTGIYFIDSVSKSIYRIAEGVENIGRNLGMQSWVRDLQVGPKWTFNPYGGLNGVRLYYDPVNCDIYFTSGDVDNDTLCYSEQLGTFSSFFNYSGAVMFPYNSKFYSLFSSPDKELKLWRNFTGKYNEIFGDIKGFDLSFISNDNPQVVKIFDTVDIRGDSYNAKKLIGDNYTSRDVKETFSGKPFDYIRVKNEYQSSEMNFNKINLRKKFRVWRGLMPRAENRRRILNTWCKITLGKQTPEPDNMVVINDIGVNYTM